MIRGFRGNVHVQLKGDVIRPAHAISVVEQGTWLKVQWVEGGATFWYPREDIRFFRKDAE